MIPRNFVRIIWEFSDFSRSPVWHVGFNLDSLRHSVMCSASVIFFSVKNYTVKACRKFILVRLQLWLSEVNVGSHSLPNWTLP